MTTIRDTARLARPLWYGSLLVGGMAGGISALVLTLRMTRPKESS